MIQLLAAALISSFMLHLPLHLSVTCTLFSKITDSCWISKDCSWIYRPIQARCCRVHIFHHCLPAEVQSWLKCMRGLQHRQPQDYYSVLLRPSFGMKPFLGYVALFINICLHLRKLLSVTSLYQSNEEKSISKSPPHYVSLPVVDQIYQKRLPIAYLRRFIHGLSACAAYSIANPRIIVLCCFAQSSLTPGLQNIVPYVSCNNWWPLICIWMICFWEFNST